MDTEERSCFFRAVERNMRRQREREGGRQRGKNKKWLIHFFFYLCRISGLVQSWSNPVNMCKHPYKHAETGDMLSRYRQRQVGYVHPTTWYPTDGFVSFNVYSSHLPLPPLDRLSGRKGRYCVSDRRTLGTGGSALVKVHCIQHWTLRRLCLSFSHPPPPSLLHHFHMYY